MPGLTLAHAQTIIDGALAEAGKLKLKPLCVVVLDARGAVKAVATQDGTSVMRFEVAYGKAYGGIAMGLGGRQLHKMATDRPFFVAALGQMSHGRVVPVPGGVLIRDGAGELLGSVGISGDTSDNDELAAVAGIAAAGLKADTGA